MNAEVAVVIDAVVVVGRDEAPAPTIPDWPRAQMGPLGGIAAALHYAAEQGFAAVLTCGVDSLGLHDNLPALLSPALVEPTHAPDTRPLAPAPTPILAAATAALKPLMFSLCLATSSRRGTLSASSTVFLICSSTTSRSSFSL